MNAEAADLWERAKKALVVARSTLSLDADAAAANAEAFGGLAES